MLALTPRTDLTIMDLQRSLLIGAIAVLSFMLLTEWVAFKDDKTAATAETTTRIISSANSSGGELPMVSQSIESDIDAGGDIPEVVDLEKNETASAVAQNVNSGRIIQIHTDVLQIAIDLKGGDIVEAALPAFLEKLDNPDVPFVLLEKNEQRLYIAQSGLIGPDGIDKGDRAVFQASSAEYRLDEGKDTLQVDLDWENEQGVTITKRFTLTRGEYLIKVEYLVNNASTERWQANLFGQIKRDSSEDPASSSGQGLTPFLGAATTQPDDRFTKFDFEDMAEEPFKAQLPAG